MLGLLRAVRRKNAEGIAALQRALEIDPTTQWRHIGMAFQYAYGLLLAQSYAFLGERDEAVRRLEKAVEQRHSGVIFVNQHPMYASLRDHPRFQEIVRRIGL